MTDDELRPTSRPAARSPLRSVALPAEHGGWGLTLEPGLLGLLIAPSPAGLCIAAGAMVAFLVRTPLKVVAVDRRRGRTLDRTRLAEAIAAVELVVLVALAAGAIALAEPWFWVPGLVALPLLATRGLVRRAVAWSPSRAGAGRGHRGLLGRVDDRAGRRRRCTSRGRGVARPCGPRRDIDPPRPGPDRPPPQSTTSGQGRPFGDVAAIGLVARRRDPRPRPLGRRTRRPRSSSPSNARRPRRDQFPVPSPSVFARWPWASVSCLRQPLASPSPQPEQESTAMTSLTTSASLAELIRATPGSERTLESFGLDYCCGGSRTLADACDDLDLDPATVLEAIQCG